MTPYQEYMLVKKLDVYAEHPEKIIFKSILGGVYISFGAALMCVAKSQGYSGLICGAVFSLGLYAIVVTGAELFTGNCMIPGLLHENDLKVTHIIGSLLVDNYIENCVGSIIVVVFILMSGIDTSTMVDVAIAKCSIDPIQLIFRGILCNMLVCLAVWIANYTHENANNVEKFISVLLPVTAFIACGFEHSIANMFFLPFGVLANEITIFEALIQLILVTLGNWIGGVFIGFLFSKAY